MFNFVCQPARRRYELHELHLPRSAGWWAALQNARETALSSARRCTYCERKSMPACEGWRRLGDFPTHIPNPQSISVTFG